MLAGCGGPVRPSAEVVARAVEGRDAAAAVAWVSARGFVAVEDPAGPMVAGAECYAKARAGMTAGHREVRLCLRDVAPFVFHKQTNIPFDWVEVHPRDMRAVRDGEFGKGTPEGRFPWVSEETRGVLE